MPTYEYECKNCGHHLDAFQKMSDKPLTDCPACHQPALKRKISAGAGIIFKGSGFYQTDLDLVLRENAVRTCVVCGVVTNICVRSTVHDAFFRGYRVVVPVDCVRATSPREQESSLWDIKTHFGTIGTSGEIIALMQDGGQSTS